MLILRYNTDKIGGETITLPLRGSVNVTVNWGDGATSATTSSGNLSHTYSTDGIYDVSATGTLTEYGGVVSSNVALTDILDWDDSLGITSFWNGFRGATNLSAVPSDFPSTVNSTEYMFYLATNFNAPNVSNWDVSNVVSMSNMFRETSFNQPLSSWNTGTVQNMGNMFTYASDFNQDIGNWSTSAVISMEAMFSNATSFDQDLGDWDIGNVVVFGNIFLQNVKLSTPNYESLLTGWESQTVQPNVTFGGGNSTYYLGGAGETARASLSADDGWIITDGGGVERTTNLILRYNTNLMTGTTIELPLGTGHGDIDTIILWGDGATSASTTSGALPHTYASDGIYDVSALGVIEEFGGNYWKGPTEPFFTYGVSGMDALTDLVYWDNDLSTTSFTLSNYDSVPPYYKSFPTNLSAIPNNIPSTITDATGMFVGASALNDPNISDWDTSNIVNMDTMFIANHSLNQPLSGWDVSNVEIMTGMFQGALKFNQNINNWQTSAVTSMQGMFSNADSFNQPLSGWDVSNVTSIANMFFGALKFNQNINNWQTSALTDIWQMFLFAEDFNQPLNDWDVSNVEYSYYMFGWATSFNQPLNNWNTSAVKQMSNMFNGATSFDQDLGDWDITSLSASDTWSTSGANEMFFGVTLSQENYDSLLIGWESQVVNPGVTFDGGNSQYCSQSATDARTRLIVDDSWTITDAGREPSCIPPPSKCITKQNYITLTGIKKSGRFGSCKEINLVDFLPDYVRGSETEELVAVFQDYLNDMYEGDCGVVFEEEALTVTACPTSSCSLSSVYGEYTTGTSAIDTTTDDVNKIEQQNSCDVDTGTISILEKIARLADLIDPDLIPIELIQHYAENLGYNVGLSRESIGENASVNSGVVQPKLDVVNQEKYLRFVVRNLPTWYRVKTTRNAIKMMLYSFGLVGDMVYYFTKDYENAEINKSKIKSDSTWKELSELICSVDQDGVYGDDEELATNCSETITEWGKNLSAYQDALKKAADSSEFNWQLTEVDIKTVTEDLTNMPDNYASTPHFKLWFDIAKSEDYSSDVDKNKQMVAAINAIRPINTVFEGIAGYWKTETTLVAIPYVRYRKQIKLISDEPSDVY